MKRLLTLFGAPLAWTVHLLAGYLIVAVWCAMGWSGLTLAISLLTVVCVAGGLASGLGGFRLWRHGQDLLRRDPEPGKPEPWDARMGERNARTAFLGVSAILMAAIFTWLIVLQGLPPFFAPACPPGTMP